VKSTLCEASHTHDMFIPQARDTCVQFSDDEPECSLFEVVTSFEKGWSLQHLTMKPSKMDASLDPKSVRFLASEDKLVWKELLSSEVAFQNRDDKIVYTFMNEETYHHYALQYEKTKETMHIGKVGLVESYTASCAANLYHKITGVSIPYYETMAPTSVPTKAPTSVPTKKPVQDNQFDNKVDLQTAINLWIDNNNSAVSQYGKIDDWDVSLILDMNRLFYNKQAFNADLSGWNVAAVTDMSYMFHTAKVFNADLSGWNVAAVTDMAQMFRDAYKVNSDLSGWDVSSVADMYAMFSGAYVFDANLSGWDVSAVTDMTWMFRNAFQFNQVLCWKISSEAEQKKHVHRFLRKFRL